MLRRCKSCIQHALPGHLGFRSLRRPGQRKEWLHLESCPNTGKACSGPKPSHTWESRRRRKWSQGLPAGDLYPGMSRGERACQQHAAPGQSTARSPEPCVSPSSAVGLEPPTCKESPAICPEVTPQGDCEQGSTLPCFPLCVSALPSLLPPGRRRREGSRGDEHRTAVFYKSLSTVNLSATAVRRYLGNSKKTVPRGKEKHEQSRPADQEEPEVDLRPLTQREVLSFPTPADPSPSAASAVACSFHLVTHPEA